MAAWRSWTFKSTGLRAAEKKRAAAQSLCEQWQCVEDELAPKSGWENHVKFENPREIAEQFVTATRKLAQGVLTEADAHPLLDELLKAGRQNPLSEESRGLIAKICKPDPLTCSIAGPRCRAGRDEDSGIHREGPRHRKEFSGIWANPRREVRPSRNPYTSRSHNDLPAVKEEDVVYHPF